VKIAFWRCWPRLAQGISFPPAENSIFLASAGGRKPCASRQTCLELKIGASCCHQHCQLPRNRGIEQWPCTCATTLSTLYVYKNNIQYISIYNII
jgi:hypothetical protein